MYTVFNSIWHSSVYASATSCSHCQLTFCFVRDGCSGHGTFLLMQCKEHASLHHEHQIRAFCRCNSDANFSSKCISSARLHNTLQTGPMLQDMPPHTLICLCNVKSAEYEVLSGCCMLAGTPCNPYSCRVSGHWTGLCIHRRRIRHRPAAAAAELFRHSG